MTTIGIKQLCKQQHLPEEIESKIALFAWKHAKVPNMPALQVLLNPEKPPLFWEHGYKRVCIETLRSGPKIIWPRFIGGRTRRPYSKKTSDKLRSKDVVIDALTDGLEVSAEIGRHKVAQLLKDAIVEDATRFVEGEPRTWRNQFWSPDIFNDIVGVLQRKKERQDRRELRRMSELSGTREMHALWLARQRRFAIESGMY